LKRRVIVLTIISWESLSENQVCYRYGLKDLKLFAWFLP